MEDLERKKQEWNKLYDSLYHGKEVTQFPVPRRGCMAREDAAELWADPDESKIQDPDDVISINFGEGKGTKKVWNKPFSVRDSKSGKSYCARETDPAVQKAPQYHDLQELISIKADNDPSWPRGEGGKPKSVAEVYNESAMCAQLSHPGGSSSCNQANALPAPLGDERVPFNVCDWQDNYETGGECVTQDAQTEETGPNKGALKQDRFSQWYKRFAERERDMAKELRANPDPSIPVQRFSMANARIQPINPYAVPVMNGGGEEDQPNFPMHGGGAVKETASERKARKKKERRARHEARKAARR